MIATIEADMVALSETSVVDLSREERTSDVRQIAPSKEKKAQVAVPTKKGDRPSRPLKKKEKKPSTPSGREPPDLMVSTRDDESVPTADAEVEDGTREADDHSSISRRRDRLLRGSLIGLAVPYQSRSRMLSVPCR